MRLAFILLFSLASAAFSFAADSARWLESSHLFGLISESGGKVSHDFLMVNDGSSPLLITRVRTSCGCTASSFSRHSIAPGDTARITLTYNPLHRPGPFFTNAYVYIEGQSLYHTLSISGTVIADPQSIDSRYPVSVGALRLERRILPFGEIKMGKTRSQYISAFNPSPDTLLVSFSHLPSHLRAKISPSKVPPHHTATIIVYFDSSRCPQWALNIDTFSVETSPALRHSDAIAGISHFTTSADVVEDFSALTTSQRREAPVAVLSASRLIISPSGRASFTITNKGLSPLIIRRIFAHHIDISVSCPVEEILPQQSTTVSLSVSPALLKGILNSHITIVTNDYQNPVQKIRIVGDFL